MDEKKQAYSAEIERAEQFRRKGRPVQAEAILRKILAGDPGHAAANYQLGMLYHLAGRNGLAIPHLETAVSLIPNSFEAVFNLGVIQHDEGMLDKARAHLECAISLRPEDPRTHSLLGQLHRDLGNIAAAKAALGKSLSLDPDNDDTLVQMGFLSHIQGNSGEARDCYERALVLNPVNGEAYYRMAMLRDGKSGESATRKMDAAYRSPAMGDLDRALTGLSLGFAFETLGQYGKAFGYFQEAKLLQKRSTDYSYERQAAFFDRHKRGLEQSFLERCAEHAIDDETPIFIVGLPRSGSSLVEQILASHPGVHGAGEVEYSRLFVDETERLTSKPFPQDIATIAPEVFAGISREYIKMLRAGAGPAQRVSDKLPHNFLRLGLFAATMNNARFILCERDPLDTCLSIYQHFFAGAHGYACDLLELGRYYRLYQDMMSHWQRLFPERIYTVSYEELVLEPDSQIRQLLSHCGLTPDPACLRFHETGRLVDTPSAMQIRKPIHRDSVGRWRHYEKQLQPLRNALGV